MLDTNRLTLMRVQCFPFGTVTARALGRCSNGRAARPLPEAEQAQERPQLPAQPSPLYPLPYAYPPAAAAWSGYLSDLVPFPDFGGRPGRKPASTESHHLWWSVAGRKCGVVALKKEH